jgi:hypothetical protein
MATYDMNGFCGIAGPRIENALRMNSGVGYFRIAVVWGGRMMRRLAVGIFLAPIGTRLRR